MTIQLSHRQRQCIDLAAQGLGNVEIGQRLGVSQKTVRTHLYAAYNKLGIASRFEVWQRFGQREAA